MMETDYEPVPLPSQTGQIRTVRSGEFLNWVTFGMKLTRGKLPKGTDWDEWQKSERKQLDQYETQGMFGTPVPIVDETTVFQLVWTYNIKELDKRKKARCACD